MFLSLSLSQLYLYGFFCFIFNNLYVKLHYFLSGCQHYFQELQEIKLGHFNIITSWAKTIFYLLYIGFLSFRIIYESCTQVKCLTRSINQEYLSYLFPFLLYKILNESRYSYIIQITLCIISTTKILFKH